MKCVWGLFGGNNKKYSNVGSALFRLELCPLVYVRLSINLLEVCVNLYFFFSIGLTTHLNFTSSMETLTVHVKSVPCAQRQRASAKVSVHMRGHCNKERKIRFDEIGNEITSQTELLQHSFPTSISVVISKLFPSRPWGFKQIIYGNLVLIPRS